MNAPPRCVLERHDAATGTVVTPAVWGHTSTGLPRMFCTLRPMNVPMSLVIAIAAFFAAAISAVVEFGPAGTLSEFAHSPAPTAFSFWSPMWSPWAWLSSTTWMSPSRASSAPVTVWPAS